MARQENCARTALAGLVILAGMMSGCSPEALHPQADLVGTWTDESGRALPDGSEEVGYDLLVYSFLASSGCAGRKDLVYLSLAWPVGDTVSRDDPEAGKPLRIRYFIRGNAPEGFTTRGSFDPDSELPPTAKPTGFVREGNRISVDPPATVYVTRPNGDIERWQEMELGCA